MRTAFDTNVLSLQWSSHPRAPRMRALVDLCRTEGALIVSGTVYAELLARPHVPAGFIDQYCADAGIEVDSRTGSDLWKKTGDTYARYCERRRQSGGGESKRLLADFIIGAHAQLHADRLATLDPNRYRAYFPDLVLIP